MLSSAITVGVAQLLWKISNGDNLKLLIIGLLLYGISSLLMIVAYRFGSLSVLHPILSVSYGVGLSFGYFFLKEPISNMKLVGVLIIMMGVILIGGGDVE